MSNTGKDVDQRLMFRFELPSLVEHETISGTEILWLLTTILGHV